MKRLVVTAVFALAVLGCSKSETQPASAPATTPAPSATPAPGAAPTSVAQDPAAARTMIKAGAVVLDVRTPEEFAAAHLPGSINVPVQELPARIAEVDKLVGGDKTRAVVAYCAAGSRSAKAKQLLEAAGYTRVVNGGGYDDLVD